MTIFLIANLAAIGITIAGKTIMPISNIQASQIAPRNILVDQFGYRPQDSKIAIISIPCFIQGDRKEDSKRLNDEYSLIDLNQETEAVVYTDTSRPWNDGEMYDQSGDCAAWFDFSEVNRVGRYVIQNDRTRERSWPFSIKHDVYKDVLVAAMRMFFYQRSGYPKHSPYVDTRWTDEAAFLGPNQDPEAHFIEDKHNSSLARDLRGGWFDAGDTNKYVTFASNAVHQLLDAYRQNPELWTDDFNIPESGNGIPDLLDEIRYEIDWLKRMQSEDGGVFIKVGTTDFQTFERPSLDSRPRFYAPQCSSATIDTASMFAYSALVFQSIPALSADADELRNRAVKAWQWYHSHPHQADCDTQEIKSGDADRNLNQQADSATAAAIYLFLLTSNSSYEDYFTEVLADYCIYCHQTWYPYNSVLGDALLYYIEQPQSSSSLQLRMKEALQNLAAHSHVYGIHPHITPYPVYMPDDQYHWGSNAVQALYGISNYAIYKMSINESDSALQYYHRALGAIHYFHGVNPLGLVYLSNMYDYGASYSVNEMYHEWFGHGIYSNALTSKSGPAPGYLTGGPNKDYTGDASVNLDYPMRAYLDSNNKWHSMQIWELSEPAIYYQSAYIKLLSYFVQD